MNWIDPRKELPTREVEVLIKGLGTWYKTNYFVSMWSKSGDGTGLFLGTGCDPDCGIFTFESWSYIEEKQRNEKDNDILAKEYSLRCSGIDPGNGELSYPSKEDVESFQDNLNGNGYLCTSQYTP